MTIFISLLMITSIIGFVIPYDSQEQGNKLEFNDVEFLQTTNNKWTGVKNNQQYLFDFLPPELTEISIPGLFILNNKKLYFIYDPSNYSSFQEYIYQKTSYNLQLQGKQILPACMKEESCPDIPVKDCTENAIFLKNSINNKVYLLDNCIVLEGDEVYQNKAIDKINQALIGI